MIDPELWRRLRDRDPEDVGRRARAELTDDGRYQLPVLGSRVRVDPQAEQVASEWPDVIPVDYFLSVSAVQYLILARDRELAGELVPVQRVPHGEVFFRGPHVLPGDALGALFGADGDGFRQVVDELGGKPFELGDVGVQVSIFPRLPVCLGLWLADDEFPARMTFLFDRTAGEHLPVDALWSAVMVLAEAIRRLAKGSDAKA